MKYRSLLLCGVALLSTAAMADDSKSDKKTASTTFEALDKDSDGRLSQSEASSSSLSSQFASLDRDSDGYVSKGEFKSNTMTRQKPSNRY